MKMFVFPVSHVGDEQINLFTRHWIMWETKHNPPFKNKNIKNILYQLKICSRDLKSRLAPWITHMLFDCYSPSMCSPDNHSGIFHRILHGKEQQVHSPIDIKATYPLQKKGFVLCYKVKTVIAHPIRKNYTNDHCKYVYDCSQWASYIPGQVSIFDPFLWSNLERLALIMYMK